MDNMLIDLKIELAKAKRELDIVIQKYMLNMAGFPYLGVSASAMIASIALRQAIKACEEWSDTFNVPSDYYSTASEE